VGGIDLPALWPVTDTAGRRRRLVQGGALRTLPSLHSWCPIATRACRPPVTEHGSWPLWPNRGTTVTGR